MGEETPTEWPELDPIKWYKCTVDAYQDITPDNSCSQDYDTTFSCCQLGANINNWLNAGKECVGGWELCILSGFSAQRLKKIEGPFADEATCRLDL